MDFLERIGGLLLNQDVISSSSSSGFDIIFGVAHWALSFCYFVLFFFGFSTVIRKIVRKYEERIYSKEDISLIGAQAPVKITQKINIESHKYLPFFDGFFIFGCMGRIAFTVYVGIKQTDPHPSQYYLSLLDWLPTFCFFTCYWLILATWLEVISLYNSQNISQDSTTALLDDSRQRSARETIYSVMGRLQIVFLTLFGLIFIVDVIVNLVYGSDVNAFKTTKTILQIIAVSLYVIFAVFFTVCGVKLIRRVKGEFNSGYSRKRSASAYGTSIEEAPLSSITGQAVEKRQMTPAAKSVCTRVFIVQFVVVFSFLTRAAVLVKQLVFAGNLSFEFWWVDCVYYLLAEIVPLFLVYILLVFVPLSDASSVPSRSHISTSGGLQLPDDSASSLDSVDPFSEMTLTQALSGTNRKSQADNLYTYVLFPRP